MAMDSLLGQRIALYAILLVFLIYFSRRSLSNPRCHGFYRFFAFMGISGLLVLVMPMQHFMPTSVLEFASVVLLFLSLLSVVASYRLLLSLGGQRTTQAPPENFKFENTANLVQSGIYRYIRHPMYTSLLLLAVALFVRNIGLLSLVLVIFSCTFVVLAAGIEERENIAVFKDQYCRYIRTSKRFIPFVV